MSIVFDGIKFGIVLAILVGPVFFTIIQTSIEKGFWKGALVAFGVSLSDIIIVVVCYFGLIQFLSEPKFRVYMAYAGGAILIALGLFYVIVKGRKKEKTAVKAPNERGYMRYMLKGFLINGLSPSVIIFWIGTVSVTALNSGYSKGIHFFLFFSAVLVTVLSTDLLKAYLADKLRGVVTPKVIMIMNLLLGIGMIIFGIRLIFLSQTLSAS